jgi:putative nucleotidyltransferase with HDIG domain
MQKMNVPKEIKSIISALKKEGFQAYMVGGCVRDFLRSKEPKDWDVTTNASPEKIVKLFPKSFLDNKFGTVSVLTGSQNPSLAEVEVTPYRIESKYSDKRHPDKVKWAKSLKEDLARRDFTVNAMAADEKMKVVDFFKGKEDLKNKVIRAVGDAQERFSEDALRMMRAVRLAASLDKEVWKIDPKTKKAIQGNARFLSLISEERVRDELMKIVMSDNASQGIDLLRELGLLKHVIPELEAGYGVSQNKHHIYEIYEHNLRCLQYAAKKDYNKHVRLAALLHDIAKPQTKKGEGKDSTFYGHEIIGAKMAQTILERLKFSKKDVLKIRKLVRYHLFYYNVGEVSPASVRRLVRQVGQEDVDDLLKVRYCDRIGSGCPKAEPYKLRHLKYLIDKSLQEPVSAKMLQVNGNDIMKAINEKPGPKIGQILDILLSEALQDPDKNKKETLIARTKQISSMPAKKIQEMSQKTRKDLEEIETKKDEMTKKKYWVT